MQTHDDGLLHNLPHFGWEFSLDEEKVELAVVQEANQSAIGDLRRSGIWADQTRGREILDELPVSQTTTAASRAFMKYAVLTKPSTLDINPSNTLVPFLATVRTNNGSNLAESSSFVIVLATVTPSPAPGV